MVVRDNAAGIDASACSGCTIDHNQTVSYTGGSGRCAYATASPKGTASDGTDIGLNSCGATQPPPPPPPSDTTAPDTSITSAPADPSTSTSASFAFTATESGSTFACKLDAGAYAACTSPKAYSALSMASHTFSVRATDAAGNTDATPATKTWTVQSASTPPPSDHQPVAAYTDTPTAPTTGQAVSFDASSATCADAPCSYTWEDDGGDGPAGDQWPLGSGKTMSFTFQGAGVKNVRVNVTDVDGDTATTMKAINVAAAGSTPPPADTTAPNTTITSGPTGTTTDNTPTFAFTASESGSTFQCRLDAGAWAACTSPWTTNALTDGMHGIAVRATDAAGNTDATPATQSFTVAAAAAPQTLVGDSTVQSTPDSNGSRHRRGVQGDRERIGHHDQDVRLRRRRQHRQHAGGRDLQQRQRPSRDAADQGHAVRADRRSMEHRHGPRRVGDRRPDLLGRAAGHGRHAAVPRRLGRWLPQRGLEVEHADARCRPPGRPARRGAPARRRPTPRADPQHRQQAATAPPGIPPRGRCAFS